MSKGQAKRIRHGTLPVRVAGKHFFGGLKLAWDRAASIKAQVTRKLGESMTGAVESCATTPACGHFWLFWGRREN